MIAASSSIWISSPQQLKKPLKILSKLDPLWQNFLDPCMVYVQKYHIHSSKCTVSAFKVYAIGAVNLGEIHLSLNMIFPTMWYVQPEKAETSLPICAV